MFSERRLFDIIFLKTLKIVQESKNYWNDNTKGFKGVGDRWAFWLCSCNNFLL